MKTLRHVLLSAHLLLTGLLLGSGANAGVNVSLNLGYFPELAPVPGYPVYYAPRVSANFFFYDGAYWLYEDDRWFTSDWYDGPWDYVDPFYVPAFVLRVPVRYYHVPPPWFHGGYYNAPPRWGHYWGSHWSQRRYGWDHWDHHRPPSPAPLPYYQRNYHGDRYPRGAHQQELHRQHYRHDGQHSRQHSRNDDARDHRDQPSHGRPHTPTQHYQEPRQRHREQANRDHGERHDVRDRDVRNRQRDTEQHQAGRREERREFHRASQFPRQPESRPDHRFNPEQRQRTNQEQRQRVNQDQRQRNYQEQHRRARQEQRQPDRQQRDQRQARQNDQGGWQARQADAGQSRGNRPDRQRQERPRHDNRGREQQR